MAFRRALSTRATFLPPTFNPSFTHISHLHHENITDHPNHPDSSSSGSIIHTYLTQMRSFGSCTNYTNTSWQFIGAFRRTGYGCIGNGLILNRYMSTSIGEADETSFPNEVPMELITDDFSTVMTGAPPMEGVGEVAIAAADSVFPVAAVQHLIDGVHSFTGLSWWLSIVVATLLIRVTTLPLLINIHKENSKFELMRVKKREIEEQLRATLNSHGKAQTLEDMDRQTVTEAFEKISALYKEYGVSAFTPFKQLCLPFPIFISFILALFNMAEKVPSFKTGGALWFTDLTTPDAMYIFPFLTALIILELQGRGLKKKPSMINSGRVYTAVLFLFSMNFPTAIFCYWIPERLFALCCASVLQDPGVRKALCLPRIPRTPAAPPSTPSADDSETPRDK